MLDEDDRRVARDLIAASRAKKSAVPPGSRFASARPARGCRAGPRARPRARPAAARRPTGGPSAGARSHRGRPRVSASGTRASIRPRSHPRFSRPNATSSSTRSMTSWLSGSWKTIPTRADSAAAPRSGSRSRRPRASLRMRRRSRAARGRRSRARGCSCRIRTGRRSAASAPPHLERDVRQRGTARTGMAEPEVARADRPGSGVHATINPGSPGARRTGAASVRSARSRRRR